MGQWHLDELYDALSVAGWRVLAQTPGDGYRLSGSWEVQRSTRQPPLVIDFNGLDDVRCLPMDEAYACSVRTEPKLSLYFGKKGGQWRERLGTFVSNLDFSDGLLTLVYTLGEHGWASASLWGGGRHLRLTVSCVGPDPLGELARGVATLLRAPELERVSFAWHEEPGENRWVIERQERGVSVRVIYFPSYPSNRDDEQGEVQFEARCPLDSLAAQVLGQMRAVMNEFGQQEYQSRWRGPFPMEDFKALSALVADRRTAQMNEA